MWASFIGVLFATAKIRFTLEFFLGPILGLPPSTVLCSVNSKVPYLLDRFSVQLELGPLVGVLGVSFAASTTFSSVAD